jgi:farnesyl-diphosphate farnesyltransferase
VIVPKRHSERGRRLLLRTILKQVSRSFYLTLTVLPHSIRDQLGLAYLFARAADSIADTDVIERSRRLELLIEFRAQFREPDRVDWGAVRAIQTALAPHQGDSWERRLMNSLEACFRIYGEFSASDRTNLCRLMGTLTKGMEMDLIRFPGQSAAELEAFSSLEDLELYTYYVAGCVGEYWTEVVCMHRPALAAWNRTEMAKLGIRFGKGLQLTNVLKDVARDLQRGRCYLPADLLKEAGLEPRDLLRRESLPALKPVLHRLSAAALGHLDQGWVYTLLIPRREFRLRLACTWPILFAGGTLDRVVRSPALLDPDTIVKIPKREVYRVLALTTLSGGCAYVGTAYWGMLRKRVV